jgi:hypothetical protein
MSSKTSRPESSATKPTAPPLFDKLYWFRVALGAVAGYLAALIAGLNYYNGVSVGILVYLISYYFSRYVWYRGIDKQYFGKIYTTGAGVYIGTFLFTWILFFTIAAT